MKQLPDRPLLTPNALALLEEIVRPDWRVFEWGGGASTVWLARRCAEAVTVEHDRQWHDAILAALRGEGLMAWVWMARPERYASMVLDYPDEHFGIVLVDGLADKRADCVWTARPKVRRGGWLVLDDSQRPELLKTCSRMAGWGEQRDVWDTMEWGPHIGRRKRATFWRRE